MLYIYFTSVSPPSSPPITALHPTRPTSSLFLFRKGQAKVYFILQFQIEKTRRSMMKPDLSNIYLQIQHYIWNVLEENSNLSRLTTTVKTQGIISNQQNQRKGNTHIHTQHRHYQQQQCQYHYHHHPKQQQPQNNRK